MLKKKNQPLKLLRIVSVLLKQISKAIHIYTLQRVGFHMNFDLLLYLSTNNISIRKVIVDNGLWIFAGSNSWVQENI